VSLKLVADPLLSTCPDRLDRSAAKSWFGAHAAWAGQLSNQLLEWFHLGSCTRRLSELGRLVTFHQLRAVAHEHGEDVNLRIIHRAVTSLFLDETKDISERMVVKAALPVDAISVNPTLLLERNAEVRTELELEMFQLSCDIVCDNLPLGGLGFVTVDGPALKQMSVSGHVAECEPVHAALAPGGKIHGSFPIIMSPGDLKVEVSADDLRRGAALFASAIAIKAGAGLQFVLGPSFWASVEERQIWREDANLEKLLRVCCAIVRGEAVALNLDVRAIRKSAAANSAQMKRTGDNGAAWRVTVTSAGVGWRLHYWHVPPDGAQLARIEFACVVAKGDPVAIP
jgi:hypothetical protein